MDKISEPKLEKCNSKVYKVVAICYNKVYAKKLKNYLPDFYNLVFGKGYLKANNTWKPVLAF